MNMETMSQNEFQDRSMGHMALHYHNPQDGALAARLLKMLGFVETQDLEMSDGSHFYRFVVHAKHLTRGDGILYLSVVPHEQRLLRDAMHDALNIGRFDEHPAVGEFRKRMDRDPEYSFHYGTLLNSLDELESIFVTLEEANRIDPELKGRLKLTYNRPIPESGSVEERLDTSPIYGGVTRRAYGKNGVQAFLETDILSSGILGDAMVLEFDYIFPDAANHILSVVEWE